jgi:hypothetical protein
MGIHGTLKHGDLTRGSYFLMGISMGYHQLGNPTWLPELEMGGFCGKPWTLFSVVLANIDDSKTLWK